MFTRHQKQFFADTALELHSRVTAFQRAIKAVQSDAYHNIGPVQELQEILDKLDYIENKFRER